MADHLDKAKGALAHAADLDVDLAADGPLPLTYLRLLDLASIQAKVATAEATERIADVLEAMKERTPTMHPIPDDPIAAMFGGLHVCDGSEKGQVKGER